MNSLERVLTALGHQEPDRVPLFLLFGMYGAKEINMPIKDYFLDPETVAQTQMHLAKKYNSDCLYSFYYASAETEAFGGDTHFIANGPPNAKAPIFKSVQDVLSMKVPEINSSPALQRILQTTRSLFQKAEGQYPIIGVAISPLSLPVMQMGFDGYLDLMHDYPVVFEHLLEKNKEFTIKWANAQIEAGATAICYFDPISSPSMIHPDLYRKYGAPLAKSTLAAINGPTASHFASGRVLPVVDELIGTGTQIIAASCLEDLAELKAQARGKVAVMGNLNGIEMAKWSKEDVRRNVKKAIWEGAPGGGFILADNHGEIPYQVKEQTLLDIAKAVEEFGTYPIKETVSSAYA